MRKRSLSPKDELLSQRKQIMNRRSPEGTGSKRSTRNLANLTSRSALLQNQRSPIRMPNSDIKEQIGVSMQSGELLVDLMKLQNIFNFEIQKLVKSMAPMSERLASPTVNDQLRLATSDKKDAQVGEKDNLTQSETKQNQPDISVVSVIATNNRASVKKMLTLQERKDKQNKVDKNMSGLKDNVTTDLDINSPKKENISDASIHQIQTDISPDSKGKPVGVKFSKDINMWNLQQ